MTQDELLALVGGLERVAAVTAAEGTGAPEVAWGDTSFSVADDRGRPVGLQPFATLVTKDHPGEPSSGLDRPGVVRLDLDVGRDRFEDLLGYPPSALADHLPRLDVAMLDVLLPHPVYGQLGWVCVVAPGPRTEALVRQLVAEAHARALRRAGRRAERRPPS